MKISLTFLDFKNFKMIFFENIGIFENIFLEILKDYKVNLDL